MTAYQPTSPVELPVHLLTPGATLYRWEQPKGATKFLMVRHDRTELWCSPEAWAVNLAHAVKPPRRPGPVQMSLPFD